MLIICIAQHVEPAVQHEQVKPEKHEKIYRPVDKEIHQEHHHTTVQPVKDREVRPEKHVHEQEGPRRKHIKRSGSDHVRNELETERIALGLTENEREVGETHHTVEEAPTIQGQHVHHHIHEHIQPVIEKETVQPVIVHKTKPIHEVHELEPKHHEATVLPPVSLDELKKKGQDLNREPEERQYTFKGEPESEKKKHAAEEQGDDYVAPSTRQTTREPSPGLASAAADDSSASSASPEPVADEKKPGIMNKLNPLTDADGDGKAGIMS